MADTRCQPSNMRTLLRTAVAHTEARFTPAQVLCGFAEDHLNYAVSPLCPLPSGLPKTFLYLARYGFLDVPTSYDFQSMLESYWSPQTCGLFLSQRVETRKISTNANTIEKHRVVLEELMLLEEETVFQCRKTVL